MATKSSERAWWMGRYQDACRAAGSAPREDSLAVRLYTLGRSPQHAARLTVELDEVPPEAFYAACRDLERQWEADAAAEERERDDGRSYEEKLAELNAEGDLREASLVGADQDEE